MKNFILLLIPIMLFLGSCREDSMVGEPTMEPVPQDDPIPEFYELNLNGRVIDEAGFGIDNATVTVGSTTVTTNLYGFYDAGTVLAPETGLYIKAVKDGFFVGGTQHNPIPNDMVTSAEAFITLAAYDETETFESSNGVSLTLQDASSLDIPANAFELDGNAYAGTVVVNMKWLDPTAPQTSTLMPGALLGETLDGETQLLQTFGMLGVEMSTPMGEQLQITEGQKATLKFPLPSDIVNDAPAEIPLWHFDEEEGIWIEEGSALKSGNEYIGEVSHFTWWNCDVPGEYTYLCLNFFDETGGPLSYADYCIVSTSWGTASGSLLRDNTVCNLAPANEDLTVVMKDNCGEEYFSVSIGSFPEGTADADVNVISAPTLGTMTVSGTLTDCNDDPVTFGFVQVETDYGLFSDVSLNNGDYSISFTVCDDSQMQANIKGVDMEGLKESDPIAVTLDYGLATFNQDVKACDADVDANMIIIFTGQAEREYVNVIARVTANEVLITADNNDAVGTIIGIQGFGTGTHVSNLFGDGIITIEGAVDGFEVEITSYGDVGGQISGKFEYSGITGTFIADRIQ